MNTHGRVRRIARRAGVAALYLIGAVAPPVVVGAVGLRAAARSIYAGAATAPELPIPDVPAHDGSRKTAIVLLGDSLTEATDFLVPFELLAASGEYNVYAVARERRSVRMFPGEIDVLPHFSYAEYHRRFGAPPDVVVVPYMEGDVEDAIAARGEFLRRVWTSDNLMLTICGGSYSVARTGLLKGRRATSHQNVLRLVRATLPDVQWVDGVRYVDDGNLISSAGITAALDATLHLLAREHGRESALRVAARAGYPHTHYLDDPSFRPPESRNGTMMLNMAFVRPKPMAVALYDGASEIALASLTDTYPRPFAATLQPIGDERKYVTSRSGLHLIPRAGLADAGAIRRLFVVGEPDPDEAARLAEWATARGLQPEQWGLGDEFVYDAALRDLARTQSPGAATDAARGLEYPIEDFGLVAAGPPLAVWGRPLALALMGLLGIGLLHAAWSRRRPEVPALDTGGRHG